MLNLSSLVVSLWLSSCSTKTTNCLKWLTFMCRRSKSKHRSPRLMSKRRSFLIWSNFCIKPSSYFLNSESLKLSSTAPGWRRLPCYSSCLLIMYDIIYRSSYFVNPVQEWDSDECDEGRESSSNGALGCPSSNLNLSQKSRIVCMQWYASSFSSVSTTLKALSKSIILKWGNSDGTLMVFLKARSAW
jgi:hypothetical protein